MTSVEQNRIERRSSQRFSYQIPVLLRVPDQDRSGTGFTQNLSSRGAMLCTDFPLCEGELVEMTLVMPSEITLADDMNVCCRARVMRREQAETGKPAVALRIEHYEFLYRDIAPLENQATREMPVIQKG
jgi:PilZ domain